MRKIFIASIALFLLQTLSAQSPYNKISPDVLNKTWDAQWITEITGKYSPAFSGVVLFRKTVELSDIPNEFVIHVSGDNRYQIYINGQYLGNGPARSDVDHWIFETYNIASLLKPGKNTIAAQIWNYGGTAPWGQQTVKTAFILQGDSEKEAVFNSNSTWKVLKTDAWTFENHDKNFFPHTTGVGPCERFYTTKHQWGWETSDFDDTAWLLASEVGTGRPAQANPTKYQWVLTPRTIPELTHTPEQLHKIVWAKGYDVSDDFITGAGSINIPANTKVEILLDQGTLTTAYPELKYSKGKDSKIQLVYNEALWNDKNEKVDRNLVEGLKLIGYYDHVYPDGSENRVYKPLWFRTYRYMQVNIETKDEPLVIHNLQGYKATFPFERKASFSSSDPDLAKIVDAGWLTAELSSHECYEDCPYYEQLQYFGDLNISNPISYMLSGDTRLMRNTIMQGEYSRKSGDLTTCSFPTNEAGKIIPFFSIAWAGIIYNYWHYTGDADFVQQFLPSVEAILDWYQQQLNEQNLLGPMPHWNFIDCTPQWPWAPEKGNICEPEGTFTGNSSILTLQYVYGLQLAYKLFSELGEDAKADEYLKLSEEIKSAVLNLCWDDTKKYIADTPDKNNYSQHANTMAVHTGVFPKDQAIDVLNRLYTDSSLIQMSMQFQAYLHQSLVKYDLADNYLDYITDWKTLIHQGFKTFPEYPVLNCRSDCHPWNAYPAYELFTIVAGIKIAAPGFSKVKIAPHLGDLSWVKASLPHKNGEVSVSFKREGENGIKGEIILPDEVTGTLEWNGKTMDLKSGSNKVKM